MNKKVSIIVPLYNTVVNLKQTLDSICNQSYENLEIIIVVNNIDEKSKNVVKEYSEKDKRIITFNYQEKKNSSKLKNIGLRSSTSDYILFVYSNDILEKDAVLKMMKLMKDNKSDLVQNIPKKIYKKNNKMRFITEDKIPKNNIVGNINNDLRLLTNNCYCDTILIRKKIIQDLFFNEDLNKFEDILFYYSIKKRANNCVLMNNSISKNIMEFNNFLDEDLEYFKVIKLIKKDFDSYDESIKNKIYANLFTKFILILMIKTNKNDIRLIKENINKLIIEFKDYKNNIFINKSIKYIVKLYLNNNKILKIINSKSLYFIYYSYLIK